MKTKLINIKLLSNNLRIKYKVPSTRYFGNSTKVLEGEKAFSYELNSNLYNGLIQGDRFSLSRAITLVESNRIDHQKESRELLNLISKQKNKKPSFRIGLSGSPGVGKSTFIEAFGTHLTDLGFKVAVLAVDPSSTKTGGSILGDKTRMYELSRNDNAYVRPTPSRGTLGGVARNTNEAILLCEAGGYDIVLVETVGVGQSETVVADMVDMFVLIVPPAGGDELQGMKKGIMEMSDLIIVNKADGELIPAARRAQSELISALKFMHPNTPGWSTKVLRISSLGKQGIDDAWSTMNQFNQTVTESKVKQQRRGEQQIRWMWREVTTSILNKLASSKQIDKITKQLEKDVFDLKLPAGRAADIIVDEFFNVNSKKDASNELKNKSLNQMLEKVIFN